MVVMVIAIALSVIACPRPSSSESTSAATPVCVSSETVARPLLVNLPTLDVDTGEPVPAQSIDTRVRQRCGYNASQGLAGFGAFGVSR